ncbi:MAG: hypothetical protein IPN34_26760 [Planctomycetes bacterium]|nr:hypothetical protein [Planctomycetota bacterium]
MVSSREGPAPRCPQRARPRQVLAYLLALAVGALSGACGDGADQAPPAAFRFLGCDQAGRDSLHLNTELWLRFSAPVDPGTLRPETIRIARLEAGEPSSAIVAGRYRLIGRGNVIAFVPDVPLRPDLEDGGLRPDSTYRVRIAGYPRPDGLRALGGELLAESAVFEFRTVGRGEVKRLFALGDATWPRDELAHVPRVVPEQDFDHNLHAWSDAETWLLIFDSPLRPDSLGSRSVRLVPEPKDPSSPLLQKPLADWPAEELIPVAMRLLRAEEARRRWQQDEIPLPGAPIDPRWLVDGCVLELRPQFVSPPSAGARFYLAFERPADDGVIHLSADGFLVPPGPLGYGSVPIQLGQNYFVVTLLERPLRSRTLSFDFLPREQLAPDDGELGLAPADGVLRTWEGVAEAVLSSEGGDGSAGELTRAAAGEALRLDLGAQGQRGLQLARCVLPSGCCASIGAEPLAVLRSQGRLGIHGQLEIGAPQTAVDARALPEPREGAGFEEVLRQLSDAGFATFALASSGELLLDGRLEAPGRVVLLASSNRVRLTPLAVVRAAALWVFAPENPAGLAAVGVGVGAEADALPAIVRLREGRFHFDRSLRPTVPLRFRAVGPSVPFGDLRRVFEPAAIAHLWLARGREADVRAYVQVGEGPRSWEGIARALRPEFPLALPRQPRARIALEVELFPAQGGDAGSVVHAQIDRLEVLLR